MSRLETTWKWLGRYKYIIVGVLFFANLSFFDHNSLLHRNKLRKEIAALRAEKERYKHMCERDIKQLHALDTDPRAVEKIARERYFMKRADEDLFVFEYAGNSEADDETAE